MGKMELKILEFFKNHSEKKYSIKELCKEFEITQPAMWRNIRHLWYSNFIIKHSDHFPVKYQFNETFFGIIKKT